MKSVEPRRTSGPEQWWKKECPPLMRQRAPKYQTISQSGVLPPFLSPRGEKKIISPLATH